MDVAEVARDQPKLQGRRELPPDFGAFLRGWPNCRLTCAKLIGPLERPTVIRRLPSSPRTSCPRRLVLHRRKTHVRAVVTTYGEEILLLSPAGRSSRGGPSALKKDQNVKKIERDGSEEGGGISKAAWGLHTGGK